MFQAEAQGLKILYNTKTLKIPVVIGHGETSRHGWILMEHIAGAGRKANYWEQLGKRLALMHKNTNDKFGLPQDNYIGSLPQKNTPLENWVEFLITNRFDPMLAMARDRGEADEKVARSFEKLYGKLKGLLVHEDPALLHGDLWSGNIMIDNHGSPVLIDPAVYYGNREVDLAFTTLFGGFDKKFYTSYQEEWPLEGGFEDRFDIYNLYPLMVHVNIFGGGYINQVKQVLSRYI